MSSISTMSVVEWFDVNNFHDDMLMILKHFGVIRLIFSIVWVWYFLRLRFYTLFSATTVFVAYLILFTCIAKFVHVLCYFFFLSSSFSFLSLYLLWSFSVFRARFILIPFISFQLYIAQPIYCQVKIIPH